MTVPDNVEDVIMGAIQALREGEGDLRRGLTALQRAQELVSSLDSGSTLATQDNIRMTMLALIDETMEYGRVMGWKPWKKRGKVDKKEAGRETADQLAFLGLQLTHMNRVGITMDQVAGAYVQKSLENIRRLSGLDPNYTPAKSLAARGTSRLQTIAAVVREALKGTVVDGHA